MLSSRLQSMINPVHCILITLALIITLPLQSISADISEQELIELLDDRNASVEHLNTLLQKIRDNQISASAARLQLSKLFSEVRTMYYQSGGTDSPKSAWHFPVAGCSVRSIQGGRKHGYISGGYDFYTGNRHGGHPSLDIFINDRNQDCRDDRSGKPVPVLSITSGIVVGLENSWKTGSRLRGGKYLWIYDPGNDLLLYYAHNGELFVRTGGLVQPGDRIASIGRTGYNAAKRRSPTHLHFTALKISNGGMKPVDLYNELKSSIYRPID